MEIDENSDEKFRIYSTIRLQLLFKNIRKNCSNYIFMNSSYELSTITTYNIVLFTNMSIHSLNELLLSRKLDFIKNWTYQKYISTNIV